MSGMPFHGAPVYRFLKHKQCVSYTTQLTSKLNNSGTSPPYRYWTELIRRFVLVILSPITTSAGFLWHRAALVALALSLRP